MLPTLNRHEWRANLASILSVQKSLARALEPVSDQQLEKDHHYENDDHRGDFGDITCHHDDRGAGAPDNTSGPAGTSEDRFLENVVRQATA